MMGYVSVAGGSTPSIRLASFLLPMSSPFTDRRRKLISAASVSSSNTTLGPGGPAQPSCRSPLGCQT